VYCFFSPPFTYGYTTAPAAVATVLLTLYLLLLPLHGGHNHTISNTCNTQFGRTCDAACSVFILMKHIKPPHYKCVALCFLSYTIAIAATIPFLSRLQNAPAIVITTATTIASAFTSTTTEVTATAPSTHKHVQAQPLLCAHANNSTAMSLKKPSE
jgi:hypothetical protein